MDKAILETSQLVLREFTNADAKWLFLLNGDSEVMKYTGDVPFESIDDAGTFVQKYDHYKRYGFGRWAVCNKQTSDWMGWCGLKFNEDSNAKLILGSYF